MSDKVIAWLRTVLPTGWSALVGWLVTLGIPSGVTDELSKPGTTAIVVTVAVAVVYPLLRWVEPHLPSWLTRLFLGSPATPTYQAPAA